MEGSIVLLLSTSGYLEERIPFQKLGYPAVKLWSIVYSRLRERYPGSSLLLRSDYLDDPVETFPLSPAFERHKKQWFSERSHGSNADSPRAAKDNSMMLVDYKIKRFLMLIHYWEISFRISWLYHRLHNFNLILERAADTRTLFYQRLMVIFSCYAAVEFGPLRTFHYRPNL